MDTQTLGTVDTLNTPFPPSTPLGPLPPSPLHHSYSDWSFQGGNWPNYQSDLVLSSPTSLQGEMELGVQRYGHSILSSHPRLPELLIVNNVNIKYDGTEMHIDWMRGQAYPIGAVPYPSNCYWLRFYLAYVIFGYAINGASTSIAAHRYSPSLPSDTWLKYRFAMWDYPNHASPTKVQYFFDLWETDHWTRYLQGLTSVELWFNSSTNYYGTFLNHGAHYDQRGVTIDDTELWVPAT
jgi:hypothetical protein